MALNGEDVVSFERDDLHRETLRHYANGLSQRQRYDEVGGLTPQLMLNGHDNSYQAQTQNNAIQHTNQLVERLYHYDKTGELTLIKDTRRGTIHYKYDPVGRLLEATSKLGKETFNFDPASNILDRYNSTQEQSSQHISNEKGYGYNRLVNNVVQEYLDQQYQYDAFGQLIRQKSSQGDLNLEWDVLGRLVRSRNNQYMADYRYDALGRRIQKRSKHHHTGQEQNIIYGWDGDSLAYESSADITKHYFYEKDSFVPLLQAAYHHSMELHQTQDWTEKTYSIYKDPLWNTVKQSQGFDDVWFYHCDHLGTPQEMSDQTGAIVWKAQYKAWGECKVEQAKSDFFENSEIISNNIRFQGQYFDCETGLHYNRYRYYSPYVGRFISKDPIGLLDGYNIYAYVPNPVGWVDPLGLVKKKPSKYALKDSHNATAQEVADSKIGGGSRSGQSKVRQKLLDEDNSNNNGVYTCWRCGQTSTNPEDMHLGHTKVPTSKGGNLSAKNTALEGAACNLSAGNSGYVKEGMSCKERGSCGAPYGR